MAVQVTPLMISNLLISILTASLATYATVRYFRQTRRSSLLAFVALMVSITLWVLTNFVRYTVTTAELKLIALNFTNAVPVPLVLYSLLWFALAYSETDHGATRWVAGLALVHIGGLGVALVLAPELLYEATGLATRGPVSILGLTFEQYVVLDRSLELSFVLYQLYDYLLVVIAAAIIVRYVVRNRNDLYTGQGGALLVGIATPLVVNGLLFVGIVPAYLNLTSMAFGVTAVAFAVAIFRYRLLRLVPVGRQQVVEMMADPVVVLDHDGRVADSNRAARELVDAGPGWRGMAAAEFFAPFPEHVEQFRDVQDVETEITGRRNGTTYAFDLNTSPIRSPNGDLAGRIIVLRDVTERNAHKRKLTQQNERLDQFSRLVSHDLRNPLTVILGRLELIDADGQDRAHLEAIEQSATRMETIISDMLALSRAGQSAVDPESVSLGAIARASRDSVDLDGVDFDVHVPATATVEADPDRLMNVFENLFRNAHEHNSPPLTIRIGVLETGADDSDDAFAGFYVEDDGTGVPEHDRELVFDQGYTTTGDGNGLGLSIVQEIVDAHDWTVSVVEGRDGGARFEIRTGE